MRGKTETSQDGIQKAKRTCSIRFGSIMVDVTFPTFFFQCPNVEVKEGKRSKDLIAAQNSPGRQHTSHAFVGRQKITPIRRWQQLNLMASQETEIHRFRSGLARIILTWLHSFSFSPVRTGIVPIPQRHGLTWAMSRPDQCIRKGLDAGQRASYVLSATPFFRSCPGYRMIFHLMWRSGEADDRKT